MKAACGPHFLCPNIFYSNMEPRTHSSGGKPRSGDGMQPTAQAVGPVKFDLAPKGRKKPTRYDVRPLTAR